MIGGAARTEHPFPKAPGLRHSTGAYLLGLMPPELLATLDLDCRWCAATRTTSCPRPGGRSPYLLFGATGRPPGGSSPSSSPPPTWPPTTRCRPSWRRCARTWRRPGWPSRCRVEETAERYVRPALRQVFVDLVRGSVVDYLERFGFRSELLVACTRSPTGCPASTPAPTTPAPGTTSWCTTCAGCPAPDGTWMIVRGGMGTVSRTFADAARAAGARIRTGAPVTGDHAAGGAATGVRARRRPGGRRPRWCWAPATRTG